MARGQDVKRYYYLKDHLGSIRATVDESGTVTSGDDYYPFGMAMDSRTTASGKVDTKLKFTGKERDTETGYDYFGARYYDARIARWLKVDPMAEKYPTLSSYCYVGNSPLWAIDLDGREISTTERVDENGKKIISIVYTATLINRSSWKYTDAELKAYAATIKAQIEKSFAGESEKKAIEWNISVDIAIGTEARKNDHKIFIDNDSEFKGSSDIGEAPIGGSYFLLKQSEVNKDDFYAIGRTGAHEFGHNAGMEHPNESTPTNLMQQSSFATKDNIITKDQIIKIHEMHYGKANK